MRNLLQTLQHRLDCANARRTLDNQLEPRVHVITKGFRSDGDPEQLHAVILLSIGEDFIELEGNGIYDRAEIRHITPINF